MSNFKDSILIPICICIEQEEPGESLSDCEKDEEEDIEGGSTKADDEEESEDGFFVPDGYLSENEVINEILLPGTCILLIYLF